MNLAEVEVFQPVITTKTLKPFYILFLVQRNVAQTNNSIEETIAVLSSTLPVAFHSGFLPISPKTGFFSFKLRAKKDSYAFSGGKYIL